MSEQRIRVLQVVKGLDIGGLHGGAERFSIDLARALPRDRYETAICPFFRLGTGAESRWLERLQSEGFEVFFAADWAGRDNFRSYLRGMAALRRRFRAGPVDIFHSHFQLGSVAGAWFKLAGGARYAVRTAHLRQEWDKGWYGRVRDLAFSNWLFPLVLDAEVGVSQAIVDYLQAHPGARVFRRRTRLIYNAIPVQPLSPARAPRSEGTPIAGMVGRLTEQKGHIYLLQAAQKVLQQMPEARFWIFGDGELRESLEQESRALGLEGRVVFWGQKDGIMEYIRSFDLFVLPSLWEGLPTVLMEAMACGVPAVATDIPGTSEMIRHEETGWLVPPRDPDRLAGQILHALRNPGERKRVAEQALQTVHLFSMETIAAQYDALYREITACA